MTGEGLIRHLDRIIENPAGFDAIDLVNFRRELERLLEQEEVIGVR